MADRKQSKRPKKPGQKASLDETSAASLGAKKSKEEPSAAEDSQNETHASGFGAGFAGASGPKPPSFGKGAAIKKPGMRPKKDVKAESTEQSAATSKPGAASKKNKDVEGDVATDDFLSDEALFESNPEIMRLKEKLAQAEHEMKTAVAARQNAELRCEREMSKARTFANQSILKSLLPILDSLSRALETPATEDPAAKSMRQGIELTMGLFEKMLQQHGIEVVDPKQGDAFDPEYHEAMSMQQVQTIADNTVVKTLQRGYALQGRVLRAAMVIVNKLS